MTTAISNDAEREQSVVMLDKLGKIKAPKSSDLLAEQLKQGILSDAFPLGAPLPTERELVSATGLSRGSVREALRILEAQGLVETKAGRYGGSTVSQPTDALLASHINLFAKGHGVALGSLVEVRQALEPMVAYLAAQNRSEEHLAELREISRRMEEARDDVASFLEENVHWHDALARASGNDLLRALSLSISGLMFEASRIENFASAEIRQRVVKAHDRILSAIAQGDADAARRRAERDLQAYAEYLGAAAAAAGVEQLQTPAD